MSQPLLQHRRTVLRTAAALLAGATVLTAAPRALAADGTPPADDSAMPGAAGTPAGATRRGAPASADSAGLQKALEAFTTEGGASAALAELRENGRPVWRGAAGKADLTTGAPARADGRFRIGSVTKTFTATVVLQLVGEGRVDLDAPIERYLPGSVPNGRAITVRQVLDHTSGIYNYTGDPEVLFTDQAGMRDWIDRRRFRTWQAQQLVDVAARHQPNFPPGTSWSYSNTNFIIAGMLVERVTGRTWQQEVERRVIRPLGLHDTVMPDTSTTVPGPHAHGYFPLPEGPADVTRLNPSVAGAAGAGISTTDDLARFNAALMTGRLLRPAQLAEMKRTVATGEEFDYGLGLARFHTPCGELWGHSGGIPGYATWIVGTADGSRQFALSYNPYEQKDPAVGEKLLKELVAKAACNQ